ncbi:unnamed protein product [Dibothriocephalus latus]|uniref:OB domain-containing protein n=1 Tax=Dibothriocephalus latus TaxID=60516 RepID=A0A3P7M1T1_DIBLA|nr:unnamed protein product [Dibothriocephalus latus]
MCGWLYSTRLSCAFLLIKDAYGITQVLVDKSFRKLIPPSDSAIKVEGEVRLRPEKDINPVTFLKKIIN